MRPGNTAEKGYSIIAKKQQANFHLHVEIGLFFTIYMLFLLFQQGDFARYNSINTISAKGRSLQ